MMTRERLLAGLEELIYVEEGMVTMLANFSKAVIEHADDVDPGKKKEMTKLLTRLYSDSTKHRKMIDEMMNMVKSENMDEY